MNTASNANIAGFGYNYDAPSVANGFRDNRTSQTRAYGSEAAQTISYGYNPTSMLQGEGAAQGGASTPALSKSYQFDAMGNRTGFSDAVAHTQVTSAYNNLNQLTGQSHYDTSSGQAVTTGSSSFGYDGDGNMSLITGKDAGGTVTGQTSYSYDDASRLIGITSPGSSKWQFLYDGMSRLRISKSWVWQNGAWVQNSEVHRVYLGMDVVQERDSQNNVIASYSGGLSARSTATGTVFYGFDGNGSVTSLTDATGAVVGSYTYDAWGNIVSSSGPKANENPYRYSGKEQLAGYYSYGYRFYSSGLGRWINRDPIEERGGANIYAMVGNNPSNFIDSYGLARVIIEYWYLFDPALGYEQSYWRESSIFHAYIIVSENDGTHAMLFHGWHEGNWNWKGKGQGISRSYGANGFLTIESGHWGPGCGWQEYASRADNPQQVVIAGDGHTAKYYTDRLLRIKQVYNGDRVLYDYLGPNSNSAVRDMIKGAIHVSPTPVVAVPGWNNSIWPQ